MSLDSPRLLKNAKPTVPHILVVEDSEINLNLAEYLIRRIGCNVLSLTHGQTAVEACRRSRFDLVLMDCLLPGMDGYTASRLIREVEAKQNRTPAVPIIAISAFAPTDYQQRCLRAGMNDCYVKPLRREMLLRIFKQWCPAALVHASKSQPSYLTSDTGTMPARAS